MSRYPDKCAWLYIHNRNSGISKYSSFPIVFIHLNLILVENERCAVQTPCVHAVSHSMYSLPFHDDTGSAQHGNQL